MRLEPAEPKNESGLYTGLRTICIGSFYFERVEPANESGFPDIYYVMRDRDNEGTIELKFAKTKEPNLKTLVRGNQKAALIDYSAGGGRRRFALCYCDGLVYLWSTKDYLASLRGDGRGWTDRIGFNDPRLCVWLIERLESYVKTV